MESSNVTARIQRRENKHVNTHILKTTVSGTSFLSSHFLKRTIMFSICSVEILLSWKHHITSYCTLNLPYKNCKMCACFIQGLSFVVLEYNSSGITSSGKPIISTLRLLWLCCSCYGSTVHKVSQWNGIKTQRQEYILHFIYILDITEILHPKVRTTRPVGLKMSNMLNIYNLCSLRRKEAVAKL